MEHWNALFVGQAFTERDLDMNGDGFVTVQDIFTYLRSKRQTATTSRRTAEESGLSRPHTLDDLHRQRLLGRVIDEPTTLATGILSRKTEEVLLTAAR